MTTRFHCQVEGPNNETPVQYTVLHTRFKMFLISDKSKFVINLAVDVKHYFHLLNKIARCNNLDAKLLVGKQL